MTVRRNFLFAAVALAGSAMLASCDDPTRATAPGTVDNPVAWQAAVGPRLVECLTDTTLSATRTIGLLGGTISAGGTTIKIPAGSVLVPTQFELVVPASKYMEIAVHGGGLTHFEFLAPVQVSIDISRCPASVRESGSLSAFYIDEHSKTLLAPMGGVLDALTGTLTFATDHFSGYAIAN